MFQFTVSASDDVTRMTTFQTTWAQFFQSKYCSWYPSTACKVL